MGNRKNKIRKYLKLLGDVGIELGENGDDGQMEFSFMENLNNDVCEKADKGE